MSHLWDDIAELEQRRDSLREAASELFAEASGLAAQIETLRAGVQDTERLASSHLPTLSNRCFRESGKLLVDVLKADGRKRRQTAARSRLWDAGR